MSGLELVYGTDAVLNLATGEVLSLADASLDELAEARERLGQLWHTRTTAAMMIDAELVRRADVALSQGESFGRTERFAVSVDRGGAVQYDSNALRAELCQKAARGELPITLQAVRTGVRSDSVPPRIFDLAQPDQALARAGGDRRAPLHGQAPGRARQAP